MYASQKEVDGAYAQIASEEGKIKQGKQKLANQEAMLQQKEKEYRDAVTKVEAGEAEISKFDTAYSSLEAGIQQLVFRLLRRRECSMSRDLRHWKR